MDMSVLADCLFEGPASVRIVSLKSVVSYARQSLVRISVVELDQRNPALSLYARDAVQSAAHGRRSLRATILTIR